MDIIFYLTADDVNASVVDLYGQTAATPMITRGLLPILKIRPVHADGTPFTEAELSFASYDFILAHDWDPTTIGQIRVQTGITVGTVQITVDDVLTDFAEIRVPLTDTNTTELLEKLGTSEVITLGAEIAGMSAGGTSPDFVLQWDMSVRNRRGVAGTGSPEPLGDGNYSSSQVDALLADMTKSWDSTKTYAQDVFCHYEGKIYVSLLGANTNQQPDTEATYWAAYGDNTTPSTDEKLKTDSADPAAGYLDAKINTAIFEIVAHLLSLKDASITNAKIAPTANIALSKLEAQPDGVTIAKSGSVFKVGVIGNAEISASAAIALSKLAAQPDNVTLAVDGTDIKVIDVPQSVKDAIAAATSFANLADTLFTSLASANIAVYDPESSKWINRSFASMISEGLTKSMVENVLTGQITTHTHAYDSDLENGIKTPASELSNNDHGKPVVAVYDEDSAAKPAGLQLLLHFSDEIGTDTITDKSGNSRSATLAGAGTSAIVAGGKFGYGYELTGESFSYATDTDFDTDYDLCLDLQLKPPLVGGVVPIYSRDDVLSLVAEIAPSGLQSKLDLLLHFADGDVGLSYNIAPVAGDADFSHILIQSDSNYVYVGIDGILLDKFPRTSRPYHASASPIIIGKYLTDYATCVIDELAFSTATRFTLDLTAMTYPIPTAAHYVDQYYDARDTSGENWDGENWDTSAIQPEENIQRALKNVGVDFETSRTELLENEDNGKILEAEFINTLATIFSPAIESTVFSTTLAANYRNIVPNSLFVSGDSFRITFIAPTGETTVMVDAWIGNKSASSAYAFDAKQKQLTFNGEVGFEISDGEEIISDIVKLNDFDVAKDLIISLQVPDGAKFTLTDTGTTYSHYKGAGGVAETSPSGYTVNPNGFISIKKIEFGNFSQKYIMGESKAVNIVSSTTTKDATTADQTHTLPALTTSNDGQVIRVGKYGDYKLTLQPANTNYSIGDSGTGYGIETLEAGSAFVILIADSASNKWRIVENSGRWGVEGLQYYLPMREMTVYKATNNALGFTPSETGFLDAFVVNAPTISYAALFSTRRNVISFDGLDDHLEVPSSAAEFDLVASLTDSWTLSIFAQPGGLGPATNLHIVSHYEDISNGWILRHNTDDIIQLYDSVGGTIDLNINSTAKLALNTWTQIDVVKVGSRVALYMDKVYQGAVTITLPKAFTGSIYIAQTGASTGYFKGSLSDFFMVKQNIYGADPSTTNDLPATALRTKPAKGFLIKE